MQTTIAKTVTFKGTGLHSGAPVVLSIHPAPANTGIWFERSDIMADGSGRNARIPALWDHVVPSRLCTLIRNDDGVTISTIEHVMAALSGTGVMNARVCVSGPEVPILDGSSAPFVHSIVACGLRKLDARVRALEILKPVEISEQQGDAIARARLEPARGLEIDFVIDFADAAIGHQSKRLNMANGAFVRELMDCRTFCRKADVDAMQANGLALGGTMDNAVVFDGAQVLSPSGLRRADEPVRHKMLDALGDLALAGLPILGRYVGERSGHAMTNGLLRAVFADPSATRIVDCDAALLKRLPGTGLKSADLRLVA
ncbi:UDP-3-O-[3-hydroxymyristoyl] N-acetylglucosamine deacetylase [Aquimixticola soesokkakensis]|uniref:UDP-3-O-acyl-N-acetylglucosamine deacetylase n=1 Tax=Aquimixticola soesokkakensis TaxID=1519096 RepID=A0A1Y5S8Y0_9RHOB|nr:UDP-3-O-acyl-N-acetylglucosamine deacetylase [Aquimixticola soesokkakensis]SLN35197.1 UDP-3-O-[3-hydroxymyristoyl] N-acetylglucosamine deacetylase [Aquimixticola soesokkakensis]